VRAGDAGNLRQLLQQLDADPRPLLFRVRRLLEALDDGVGDQRAEQLLAHPACRARGGDRRHADEDRQLEAELAQPCRIAANHARVHAELRLHEVRARLRLGEQALRIPVGRRVDRHVGGADDELQPAFDLGSGGQLVLGPHARRHRHEVAAVEVEHRLRLGLVAELGVVAGEHQDVVDAQRRGTDQIALQRKPVAVAAGHLEDRLEPALHEEMRGDEAGEVYLRTGAVGDVDRSSEAPERHRSLQELGGIGRHRRRDLRGNDEVTLPQAGLEFASCAPFLRHGRKSYHRDPSHFPRFACPSFPTSPSTWRALSAASSAPGC
jgi:hypothetical protein